MTNQDPACRRTQPCDFTIFFLVGILALFFSACDSTTNTDDAQDNHEEEIIPSDVELDISGTVIFARSEPQFKYARIALQNYEASEVSFEWILNPASAWPSDYVQTISESGTSDSLSYSLNYALSDCREDNLMLKFSGEQCDQPSGNECDEIGIKRSAPLYIWGLADTVFAMTLPSDPGEILMLLNVFSTNGGNNVRCSSDPQTIDVLLVPQVCDVNKIPSCFSPDGVGKWDSR